MSSERPEVASDSGQHTSLRKHVCPLKGECHHKIRTHRADQCSSFSNLDNASGVTSVDWAILFALSDPDRLMPQVYPSTLLA